MAAAISGELLLEYQSFFHFYLNIICYLKEIILEISILISFLALLFLSAVLYIISISILVLVLVLGEFPLAELFAFAAILQAWIVAPFIYREI